VTFKRQLQIEHVLPARGSRQGLVLSFSKDAMSPPPSPGPAHAVTDRDDGVSSPLFWRYPQADGTPASPVDEASLRLLVLLGQVWNRRLHRSLMVTHRLRNRRRSASDHRQGDHGLISAALHQGSRREPIPSRAWDLCDISDSGANGWRNG